VIENTTAKYFSEVPARPTRAGATFPVTQIAGDERASSAKWNDLPPVTAVNSVRLAKPGATVLLTGVDNRKQDQIVLAYQRYGRGKAIALPIQDTWAWQMDAKTPVTDRTHAMFWRRLIRWLVDGVPEQVNVSTTADRVEPGEAVTLAAEVLDSAYVEVNDSRVVAKVASPSGKTTEVPVEWTVSKDGEYRTNIVPEESGIYEIRVSAARDQKELGTAAMHVRVSAGDAEYFD